jgi:hypothetical protein
MTDRDELVEVLAEEFVLDYLDRDVDFGDVAEFVMDNAGESHDEDLYEDVYELATALLSDHAQRFEGRND